MDQQRMRSRTLSVMVLRVILAVESLYTPRRRGRVTCPPWDKRHPPARKAL